MSTPADRRKVVNGHIYTLIPASAIEVGLLCDGKAVRTWWAQRFDGVMPSIDHPTIRQAIDNHEQLVKEYPSSL